MNLNQIEEKFGHFLWNRIINWLKTFSELLIAFAMTPKINSIGIKSMEKRRIHTWYVSLYLLDRTWFLCSKFDRNSGHALDSIYLSYWGLRNKFNYSFSTLKTNYLFLLHCLNHHGVLQYLQLHTTLCLGISWKKSIV